MTTFKKISNTEDLNSIREEIRKLDASRTAEGKTIIRVCVGGGCLASGSAAVKEAL